MCFNWLRTLNNSTIIKALNFQIKVYFYCQLFINTFAVNLAPIMDKIIKGLTVRKKKLPTFHHHF